MKKRKAKDFIALYAQEDGEKLVLIQSGTSADKTFLDTFWTAHTHALAMADVQTGQVISGRCYLSWPLTDKERESGGSSKRFAKGRIYRIKARGWKGDALSEPQWYVTEILEEGVPCPALEELWAEYTKPILLEDEVLGTLTLDREMSMFTGTCRWMGKEVQISLDVEIEKKASWTRATNVMKKLLADQEVWDKSLRAMAAQKLTAQANEWLADNDQTDRDPEKDPITGDEFARRIILTEFSVSGSGVGDSLEQQVYLATFNTIRHIADQGPCVIIGRCADYALADYPNHLSLFISAPLEVRIQRVAQRQNLTPEKARQLILKTDKRRASYYEYYSSKKWGSVDSYHFCIDSSYLGLGRTVELIQAMVAHKEHPIPSPTEEDPTRPRT